LKFRKEIRLSDEFKAPWEKIKQRTRYRIAISTANVINNVVSRIRKIEPIQAPRIATTVVEVGSWCFRRRVACQPRW
jgi:type III restriction enzyme